MNQSLQQYAQEYMNYYDFSENGNSVIINPGTDSLFRVYDENLTRLYEIDVKQGVFAAKRISGKPVRNNGTLSMKYPPITLDDMGYKIGDNSYYIDNILLNQFPVVVDNPIIPRPIYNDHGMYYVYETDISKFDKDLSYDLYLFYNNLTIAESYRQYIQNYLDSHPNGKLNGQYFDAYMDMRIRIIYAANMAKKILKELDIVENHALVNPIH